VFLDGRDPRQIMGTVGVGPKRVPQIAPAERTPHHRRALFDRMFHPAHQRPLQAYEFKWKKADDLMASVLKRGVARPHAAEHREQ
jgi:hypothetical protein